MAKQLNFIVEDEVKQAAVDGAKEDGMMLRAWIARAIMERRRRQVGALGSIEPNGETGEVNLRS